MEHAPQTWHYGLMARWWGEFDQVAPAEIAFYRDTVEGSGEPALDLACGAGRLLLPLLREGMDVDGCDISADMLAECRGQANAQGLSPRLYQQAMHELDLPRRYRTIYICDAFGTGGSRAQDAETLRRCHQHLDPGGTLVFNHFLPYDNASRWPLWMPEARDDLPQPWPESLARRPLQNGADLDVISRIVAFDPLQQRLTLQTRLTLIRGEQAVRTEEYTLQQNLYFYRELLDMVHAAGFSEIEVVGGYDREPFTADDVMMVVIARKQP